MIISYNQFWVNELYSVTVLIILINYSINQFVLNDSVEKNKYEAIRLHVYIVLTK